MGSSAWAPVAESSASGWTPVHEETPGYFQTLGNDLAGIPHVLAHPIETGKKILSDSLEQAHKAKALMSEGKWAEAADALPRAIPILGPLAGSIKDDIDAGHFAPALARITELFAPKGISKTVEMAPGAAALAKSVPGKIASAVDQPGLTKILGGAGEVGAGAGAMTTGHPVAMVYGAGSIAKGISRVSKGLAERRAAISEAIQAAADKAAAEQAALTSGPIQGAQRQPIWAAAQPQAEASPVTIGPTQRPVLPSNRAPYNQDAAPANVVEMPTPQSLPVRPAARPTIAQIEPQPKAYDSKAAVKRQTDQAFKMADILKQADITPGDLADLTMDHWKQVGEATGLGPPSPYSIQRARFELSKITDAPQVSPELAAQLKRKGALSIAQQLADEMQK